MSERDALSNDRKKTPAGCQGRRSGERLIERPWLQLICCAPVSSREVGCIFWSEGKSSEKRSLGSKIGTEWTGIELGPVDVNL